VKPMWNDGRRFSGRVALVTGAGGTLGGAVAAGFGREGASVVVGYRSSQAAAEAVVAEIEAEGGAACAVQLDVTDQDSVDRFVAQAEESYGRLDVLVNTAGGVAGQVMRPVESVSDEDWRVIFGINLDGAFHFTRAVVPMMKRGGGGAIVNISSGAGRSYSLTGIQAYASAKAGLIGFTRQTARELGPHGIRVNCIAPGFLRSNPASEAQWQAMGEKGQQALLESIALRRLGTPEDIARAVVFFASDDAGWITGQTISVDGGHWMLG
jgi:3-oxoacyl-[acyl-carrier protein] reductase